MHHSLAIIVTLSLSSCAVGNANNLRKSFNLYDESIECPASVCTNIFIDSDVYKGMHILQPNNNIEDSIIRF
jgi:hypothetical protein